MGDGRTHVMQFDTSRPSAPIASPRGQHKSLKQGENLSFFSHGDVRRTRSGRARIGQPGRESGAGRPGPAGRQQAVPFIAPGKLCSFGTEGPDEPRFTPRSGLTRLRPPRGSASARSLPRRLTDLEPGLRNIVIGQNGKLVCRYEWLWQNCAPAPWAAQSSAGAPSMSPRIRRPGRPWSGTASGPSRSAARWRSAA